ncbi:MAG TPA: PEP-CTERM sorting domain-containing protein [Gammaproteobacteria bacterium]|nr:PEP-CTERM sorting domain-containing protein [Gammaproteobacteria bacterium]
MNRTLKRTLIAAAVALPAAQMAGPVNAAPLFQTGLNSVFFQNSESQFRSTQSCLDNGGCLPSSGAGSAPAPAGWQQVDGSQASNVLPGDVFAGIFNVQNIDNSNTGGTIWSQNIGSGDTFGGYFAQQVSQVLGDPSTDPPTPDPYPNGVIGQNHLVLTTPTTDPFGKLAAGEMFQLYTGMTYNINLAPGAGVAAATSGTFWGSLGAGALLSPSAGPTYGLDPDGYAYSHIDTTNLLANASNAEAFFGLNLVNLGPAYNLGNIQQINDNNENELGGLGPNPITGQCFPGLMTCTDFIGTSELEQNPSWTGPGGVSPWFIRSNDPFEVYVPEPATVALMGLGLFGMAGIRRRQKNKA